MNAIVQTKGLTKVYGKQFAADNVDINVSKGEIYGLLGRNGAGKTSLMKMLLGLSKPNSGEIKLFGKTPAKKTYYRIGSIIETPGFYSNLTAKENLELFLKIRGTHRKSKEVVLNALKTVGLENETKKTAGKFSLGMKQRLGLAAAILHEPELLVLDEPINGLDPVGIHELREFFVELKKQGTTLLISSHILSEIELIADTIGVMHEGKLIEEVSMTELHKKNRRFVEFEVSDDSKAALILEQKFKNIPYSVKETNKLRIYDMFDIRGEINAAFNNAGIYVYNIGIEEERLEDYFSRLIGGGKVG